jgi:micrococcal nuclease
MKTQPIFRCLFVLVAFVCLHSVATAATLQAKVVEVQSGNSLVVSNINRSLRIRLKAIAPPDARQPFSEASLEHLKALILDKTVTVEYTELSDGYLEAKVFLNGVDVGSQMLRDGVAWYDRSRQHTLNAGDRELYERCEQLARDEKRGLWQDSAAVAPWDFRKPKQETKTQSEVSFNSVRAAITRRAENRQKSFSNTDLFGGMVGPGSIAGNPTFKVLWPNAAQGEWHTFQWQNPRFSISVPGDSFLFECPILDVEKKIVNINYILGSSDQAIYSIMWAQGANDGSTDISVADSAVADLTSDMNRYFQSKNLPFRVEASPGKYMKIGNYSGKQYTLTGGSMSGVARVISRQLGGQRLMYALAVIGPGSEWGSADFLNSLKIAGN